MGFSQELRCPFHAPSFVGTSWVWPFLFYHDCMTIAQSKVHKNIGESGLENLWKHGLLRILTSTQQNTLGMNWRDCESGLFSSCPGRDQTIKHSTQMLKELRLVSLMSPCFITSKTSFNVCFGITVLFEYPNVSNSQLSSWFEVKLKNLELILVLHYSMRFV